MIKEIAKKLVIMLQPFYVSHLGSQNLLVVITHIFFIY